MAINPHREWCDKHNLVYGKTQNFGTHLTYVYRIKGESPIEIQHFDLGSVDAGFGFYCIRPMVGYMEEETTILTLVAWGFTRKRKSSGR